MQKEITYFSCIVNINGRIHPNNNIVILINVVLHTNMFIRCSAAGCKN